MAKKSSKFVLSAAFKQRLAQWENDDAPAPRTGDVLSLIAAFLLHAGYSGSSSAVVQEAGSKGLPIDLSAFQKSGADSLSDVLAVYYRKHKSWPSMIEEDEEDEDDSSSASDSEDAVVDDEAEETSDDSSDEDSESSDSDDEETPSTKKRKRVATPESSEASSDSESDSESSSASSSDDESSDAAPPAKRAKKADSDSSDSDSSSASSSSDSEDASSSSSDDSSSDSDSDSESESSAAPPAKKKKKQASKKAQDNDSENSGSATSVTLSAQSPPPKKVKASKAEKAAEVSEDAMEVEDAGMHPDRLARLPSNTAAALVPATDNNIAKLKKSNVPFSRIPADTKIDPRFASNAYVSYDYADRAHQDLIVTKGKGFTKEKNKKKRGSYRGGMIDTTPKGIKFED